MKNARRKSFIPIISAIAAAAVLFAIPAVSVAESSAIDAPTATNEQAAPAVAKAPGYTAEADADGRSHIKISWSTIKDAEGYTVHRSSKSDKPGKEIYSTEDTSKKSYKDKGASINETYWYTVKAWKYVDGKKFVFVSMKSDKVTNALKYKDLIIAKAYAYSGGGTTASGKKAQVGRVAVDPNVIELGTWLYIEDYGLCEAADTGGSIKGAKVDLYMESVSECYEWGVRQKNVYILE
jgi:3D (Asp-Asp-Asp) domain-containing protein